MTGEPPPPAPSPSVPAPPGPGASRHEWHEWRRQQRHQWRSQWPDGGWYGPSGWGGGRAWGWFWGAALVVIGLYFLLSNLGLLSWLRGDVLWPVLLILLGVALLLQRGRGGWF